MDILMQINDTKKSFHVKKVQFVKRTETGFRNELFIYFKEFKHSDLIILKEYNFFDCNLIFTNSKEFVKILIMNCSATFFHENEYLILSFNSEYSYPIIHSKLFEWIDLKLRLKLPSRYWLSLDEKSKFYWLRLNFEFQKNNPVTFNHNAIIDGLFIKDELDFLCEIGEQLVNYGYMGSDLDGLDDALTTGIGGLIPILPFDLKWINFSHSQKFMQDSILQEICNLLLSLPNCNFQKIG